MKKKEPWFGIHFLWRENNLLSEKRNFRKEITTSSLFKLFLDFSVKDLLVSCVANEHMIKC